MKKKKFEEVFKNYSSVVMKYVYFHARDEELAQEICQQTFLAYYKNMDNGDDDLIKAWLLRTAKNEIIDYRRKSHNKYEVARYGDVENIPCGTVREGNVESVAERIYNIELTGKIMKELRQVNRLWYEIIELICIEGYSQEEASEKLGITLRVLRARLYRARNYVRDKFGEEYKKS